MALKLPWPLQRPAGNGEPAPMPIIIGAPRSGTTLLRLMLDAHPALAIPPETHFLSLGFRLPQRGPHVRERFCSSLITHGRTASNWPDFGIPAEKFRDAVATLKPFSARAGIRLFYKLYAERFGKTRWGDKTPSYCLHMPKIRRLLPEARFIHLIRDGRDVALSLREQWFSPGPSIEAQALLWSRYVRAARRAGREHADYLEVRYEELVLDPATLLRRICEFIELDYTPRMLSYHEQADERLREHQGRQFRNGDVLTQEQRLLQQKNARRPPDPSLVQAWRQHMSTDDRRRFEKQAGRLLTALGYAV